MFRDTSTIDSVKPYVDRAINDDDIRKNVTRAFRAARKVYAELNGNDAMGVASKLGRDDKVRDEIDTTVQSLSEALVHLSGNHHRRRSGNWGPFVLLVLAAIALFNPATGTQTRSWIKDHLFGSEEEFEYGPPKY